MVIDLTGTYCSVHGAMPYYHKGAKVLGGCTVTVATRPRVYEISVED